MIPVEKHTCSERENERKERALERLDPTNQAWCQVALGLLWNLTAAAAAVEGSPAVAGVPRMTQLIANGVLELAATSGRAYFDHAGIQVNQPTTRCWGVHPGGCGRGHPVYCMLYLSTALIAVSCETRGSTGLLTLD